MLRDTTLLSDIMQSDFMQFIKGILAGVAAWAMSVVYPIQNYLYVIMFLAFWNIVFGWLADKDGFRFKKLVLAVLLLVLYMLLLYITMATGKMMEHDNQSMREIISWITYAMIYFYGVNILRNLNIKWPKDKTIFFLYWVLSFKVIENIKFMKEFKETVDKEENK